MFVCILVRSSAKFLSFVLFSERQYFLTMQMEKLREMPMQTEISPNIFDHLIDLKKLFFIMHSSFFQIFFKINQSKILIIAFMYFA